ncbi:MAG: glycosyltransferase family 2 protein [Bacteroidales bacterium]|nr:glycosyltransferase family 2 protein [Bacteroidales bacterium]MDD4603528.1 glycosyltransferase family 2 protein [Bacteroidales bacterium]
MSKKKPDYSIVVPVYNSHESLEELFRRIEQTMTNLQKSFEVIFVDDDSTDISWNILEALQKTSPEKVVAIRLARNFGQHNATICGIAQATGSFIITLDDDLQNPPEEIAKLISTMQNNDADLVYGIYSKKKHSLARNLGSKALKATSRRIYRTKGNGSSFRLMKSSLGKCLLNHQINFIYIDELFNWYTNHIEFVLVDHQKRPYQKSTYTSHRLFSMLSNLIIYYTAMPLKMMVYGGFISALLSFITAILFIYRKLMHGVPIPGFTALIVAILFSTSIILLSLGVIGEYLSRIYMVQNRKPPFAIKTLLNHEVL